MPLSERRIAAVRLKHRVLVADIARGDAHRAAACRLLRARHATSGQFAVAMHRAAFELLGAFGCYGAAGLELAARSCRAAREEVLELRARARRHGGR